MTMTEIIIDNLPDHVDIDMRYYPDGVGPGGFSPVVLKAHVDMCQLARIHEMDGIKSWIVLWLLDHIDWDRIVTEEVNMKADGKGDYMKPTTIDTHEPAGPMQWRDGE